MQLTFKAKIAEKVKDGTKLHTIRPIGKRVYRVGQTLQLVSGQRYQKIIDDVVCTDVTKVYMTDHMIKLYVEKPVWKEFACLHYINYAQRQTLVNLLVNDGFECLEEFKKFFELRPGNTFTGQLICWRPFFELYPELKR